jgi:general secretion pathway protein G
MEGALRNFQMKPSVRLIRLGIGVVSIAILAVVAFYLFRPANVCGWSTTKRAREAILRNDLFTVRQAIDNYTLDKQHPPKSLQDLVDAHYLREIPTDPFSCKKDWLVPIEDMPLDPDLRDVPLSPDLRANGIVDVHSSSNRVDGEGAAYSTW